MKKKEIVTDVVFFAYQIPISGFKLRMKFSIRNLNIQYHIEHGHLLVLQNLVDDFLQISEIYFELNFQLSAKS